MIHGKQFAILTHSLDIERCESIHMKNGWILNHDRLLPVTYNSSTDTALIGNAWQVLPDRMSPEEAVKSGSGREALIKEAYSWCGRYVLYIKGEIYLDAAGLFGVFVCSNGAASDMSFFQHDMFLLDHMWQPNDVMRWFPCPGTPYIKIKRLMPTQYFSLNTDTVYDREEIKVPFPKDDTEKLHMFENWFANSLRNMQEHFKGSRFLIALTGGVDSRTTLALTEKASLHWDCFTMEHDKMPLGDLEYPPKLCDMLDRNYVYIKRNQDEFSQERYDEYLRHICHMQQEEDLVFYAYGQYRKLQSLYDQPLVLVRSGIWEIAEDFYGDFFKTKDLYSSILDRFELVPDEQAANAFRTYLKEFDTRNSSLGKINQFYLEQKCGGWMSETEHGFDIYDDIISIHPFNSRILIDMIASFPDEERTERLPQKTLTNEICPEFSSVPYGANGNFSQNRFEVAKDKLGKLTRRLSRIGVARTARLYKSILAK